MEPHSPASNPLPAGETLEGQLREMYGRVAYTHKTHEKMADANTARHKTIKAVEIGVTALATGSLLLAILGDSKAATVIGAIFSTASLAITLYFKEATLGEQSQKHTATASRLWGVREQLLSLLVDLHDQRPEPDIRAIRDHLNAELEQVYKAAPRTSPAAYAAAQRALKDNEELYFSDDELDHLLPKDLRRKA
ncbi:hypothetical protein GALL_203690 [mine drainage metagenome]|uniref:SMODS and SLOG-associating 2TM effector domain-containing protein n=1 Tax=mine drainage metagenome TaxID=410659 RepID=A0A1J5RPT6_9ZZZZ